MNVVTSEGREWTSSLIKRTEYTPDSQTLAVEFPNGTIYVYSEIPENEYHDFCEAESQGKYFGAEIRNKKPFLKQEETK